jgi:hypothetical protein
MCTAYLELVEPGGKVSYRSYAGTRLTPRPVDFLPRTMLYQAHRVWIEEANGDVMIVKNRENWTSGPVDPKEFFVIKLKAMPTSRAVW